MASSTHLRRLSMAFRLLIVLAACLAPVSVFAAEPTQQPAGQGLSEPPRTGAGFHEHREVRDNEEEVDVNSCSTAVPAGFARCHSRVRTDARARSGSSPTAVGQAQPPASVGPGSGYDPAYLQSAYNLTATSASAGQGQVVAIVDALDDPTAASDLANYRSAFGLPALPACTSWPSATPCFRKSDQNGGTTYPTADRGWAEEISLDLDMVSAICPKCTILLVEANSAAYSDLGTAVNKAVALGARVVSNSYGGGEFAGETGPGGYDALYYNHPGVAITVSSGDAGYGVEFPAASPYVTAVGGTSLQQTTKTGTRNATETAWSGAGSGCSAFASKPTWQKDACAGRTVADVSAVADPSTGVWVYATYGGDPGWMVFGGTSVAAPVVGATYALAGNGSSNNTLAAYPYADTPALNDVVSGTNGACGGTYLCTAGPNFDGPTGLGTPNSTAAFKPAPAGPAGPVPSVSSLSPTHAPAGQTVTITGSNFTQATAVAFGGVSQTTLTVNSDTQITTTAPAQPSAGTVDVKITTPNGTSTGVAGDRFGYDPVVNSLSPAQGPAGATVTISGTNLSGATAVSFGGTGVTPATVSATQVTVVAPNQPSGTTSAVTVTTPVGISNGQTFTFTAAPVASYSLAVSPTSVSVAAGNRASFNVNLASVGGYNSPVTLKVTGLPAGTTPSISPNPATPTSTGTVVAVRVSTFRLARGTYPLTFTGTGADGTTQTTTATLTVR